jgi:hypothetical protein
MQLVLTCLVLLLLSGAMVAVTFAAKYGAYEPAEWLTLLKRQGDNGFVALPIVFILNFATAYDLVAYLRFKAGLTVAPHYLEVYSNPDEERPRLATKREKILVCAFFFLMSLVTVFTVFARPST